MHTLKCSNSAAAQRFSTPGGSICLRSGSLSSRCQQPSELDVGRQSDRPKIASHESSKKHKQTHRFIHTQTHHHRDIQTADSAQQALEALRAHQQAHVCRVRALASRGATAAPRGTMSRCAVGGNGPAVTSGRNLLRLSSDAVRLWLL